MISVCIATYNGEKYIKDQLNSIIHQLCKNDEIIISDDGSNDNTLSIIESFKDFRIKIFHNKNKKGIVGNFENALRYAKGEYIFLSDQDDVWIDNKVDKILTCLQHSIFVFSNAIIVNENLEQIGLMYEYKNCSGFIKNLMKNNFIGATIAFQKKLLDKALPFPIYIPMHDQWLGLLSECIGKVSYIADPLILYRRHCDNASYTTTKSKYNFYIKLKFRMNIIVALLVRFLENKYSRAITA